MLPALTAFIVLLTGCCLVQAITGREFVRLSRRPRRPAQIRLEYFGCAVLGVGGTLLCVGADQWSALGLVWAGLLVAVAASLTPPRRK
jgi:hypothetical protein